MRKAVCKNNRQQVVFQEKSGGFKRTSAEVTAMLKLCVYVRARAIEKGMHIAAAFHGKLPRTISESNCGLIGKCPHSVAWLFSGGLPQHRFLRLHLAERQGDEGDSIIHA